MQYTIRNIPVRLDQSVREMAQAEKISLNQAVIELLSRGAAIDQPVKGSEELGLLSGSWVEDSAFDNATAAMRPIDRDLWK